MRGCSDCEALLMPVRQPLERTAGAVVAAACAVAGVSSAVGFDTLEVQRAPTADAGLRWTHQDGGLLVILPQWTTDPSGTVRFAVDEAAPDPARALDGWRRATAWICQVLAEAVLADAFDPERLPAWLRVGWAIHLVEEVAPELGLLRAELRWAQGLDLQVEPRGGAAVLSAWREGAAARAGEHVSPSLVKGRPVGARDWVEAGVWLVEGGLRRLLDAEPVFPPAQDVPCQLSAWSFARLDVPASARGGHVVVRGGGGVKPAWAVANRRLQAVAGATGQGCRLEPELGGPVGSWRMLSAGGWGQVFGGRGLTYTFYGSGRFEVLLADAYVGTAREVATAATVGTSGRMTGRWTVAGPRQVRFHDLTPQGVTVHGRDPEQSGQQTAMPADSVGLAAALQGMTQGVWRWTELVGGEDDGLAVRRLQLLGQMGGMNVDVRLAEASGWWGTVSA